MYVNMYWVKNVGKQWMANIFEEVGCAVDYVAKFRVACCWQWFGSEARWWLQWNLELCKLYFHLNRNVDPIADTTRTHALELVFCLSLGIYIGMSFLNIFVSKLSQAIILWMKGIDCLFGVSLKFMWTIRRRFTKIEVFLFFEFILSDLGKIVSKSFYFFLLQCLLLWKFSKDSKAFDNCLPTKVQHFCGRVEFVCDSVPRTLVLITRFLAII